MDIIIICYGICHCRDFHCSSQKFHREVEVSKQLFSEEIHEGKKEGGHLAKTTGESGTLLFCHCFLKDSMTFPIGYRWYGFLYLYFKISFRGPVLTKKCIQSWPETPSRGSLYFEK